jgi:hypothetical protein
VVGAGLAALALVALARSTADASPATTAALSFTLTTIARGTRLSRGRRCRDVVGVECLWGSRGCIGAKGDLL